MARSKRQCSLAHKPRDPNIQQQTYNYHDYLESEFGSENFVTSMDRYDAFINIDK